MISFLFKNIQFQKCKYHVLKPFTLPLPSRYLCDFAAARHAARHFKLSCTVTDKVACVV